jgi:hypothetical protein
MAVFKAPGSGQGHDKAVTTPLDQLEVRCRGKGRIGYHDDHLGPRRTPKADEHPAKQRVF